MPLLAPGGALGSAGAVDQHTGFMPIVTGTMQTTTGQLTGNVSPPFPTVAGTISTDVDGAEGPALLESEGVGGNVQPIQGLALNITVPAGTNTKAVVMFGVHNNANFTTGVNPTVTIGSEAMRFKGTADGAVLIQRAANWFVFWLDNPPTGPRQVIAGWPHSGFGEYSPRSAYLAAMVFDDAGVMTIRVGNTQDQPEVASFAANLTSQEVNSLLLAAIAVRVWDPPNASIDEPADFTSFIEDDTGGDNQFIDFLVDFSTKAQETPATVPLDSAWSTATKFGFIGIELASFAITGADPDPGLGQGGENEGTGNVTGFGDGTLFDDGSGLEDSESV